MKKKARRLVLSKETILYLEGPAVAAAQAGDSLTNCMAISCIGDMCAETDPPCLVQTA